MAEDTAKLEVPPTGDDEKCQKCGKEVYQRFLCRDHFLETYSAAKGRNKPRISNAASGKEATGKPDSGKPVKLLSGITKKDVETMIVVSMSFLAGTVDDSFNVMQADGITPQERVSLAADQMMPWIEIHGHVLIAALPWLGLAGGMMLLAQPAFDPCIEIVSGMRKPKIMRNGPDDLYTPAGKRYLARLTEAKAEREALEKTAKADEPKDDGSAVRN